MQQSDIPDDKGVIMSATCIKLLEQAGLDSEGHPITTTQPQPNIEPPTPMFDNYPMGECPF